MKGKQLAYQITRAEGNALNYLALALRPEWTPRTKDGKSPGAIWLQEIEHLTFPHAESFDHCMSALVDYCRAEKNGKPRYTHPTLYPGEGDHWTRTVPVSVEKNPRTPCKDHPDDPNNHWNCIGCRSEILAGDRPEDMQGKPLTPEKRQPIPSPGIRPQQAHSSP